VGILARMVNQPRLRLVCRNNRHLAGVLLALVAQVSADTGFPAQIPVTAKPVSEELVFESARTWRGRMG
jgi:hypothetical protein